MASTAVGDVKVAPSPTVPTSPKPEIFFTTPPEIRDMVYELAYGDVRELRLKMSRVDWERGEQRRKMREREDYRPSGSYPESSVSHLIVNKQYFEESCRVWLRSKSFKFSVAEDLNDFLFSKDSIQRFMLPFVTTVELGDAAYVSSVRYLNKMPALRSLSLRIYSSFLEYEHPSKIPWLDAYTDVEIAGLSLLTPLLSIRGLRSIKLNWEAVWDMPEKQECLDRWGAFRAQAERLVHDVVTKPREEGKQIDKALTLSEALEAKKSLKDKAPTITTGTGSTAAIAKSVDPLSYREVPATEDELLRLCLARPTALLEWMKEAAKKEKQSTKSSTTSMKPAKDPRGLRRNI